MAVVLCGGMLAWGATALHGHASRGIEDVQLQDRWFVKRAAAHAHGRKNSSSVGLHAGRRTDSCTAVTRHYCYFQFSSNGVKIATLVSLKALNEHPTPLQKHIIAVAGQR
jgi:hypothetical protein